MTPSSGSTRAGTMPAGQRGAKASPAACAVRTRIQARPIASHHRIGWNILGDFRSSGDESVRADMTELMHPAHARGYDPFLEYTMASQFGRIGDNRVVADIAVMGDMGIIHNQHAIADACEHAAAFSPAMDRREFADAIVVADLKP